MYINIIRNGHGIPAIKNLEQRYLQRKVNNLVHCDHLKGTPNYIIKANYRISFLRILTWIIIYKDNLRQGCQIIWIIRKFSNFKVFPTAFRIHPNCWDFSEFFRIVVFLNFLFITIFDLRFDRFHIAPFLFSLKKKERRCNSINIFFKSHLT